MTIARRLRLVRLALAVLACAGAGWSQARTLAELEAWAVAGAPEARLAALEAEAREMRVRTIEADRGARFVAGASAADAREPVTDILVRDYRRASAHAGLRWPLLGGGRVQDEALGEAQAALAASRLRGDEARDAVRQRLRAAYLDAWFAHERAELGAVFLRGEGQARRWLQRRTRARLLLDSDRLTFVSMFDLAVRERTRERAAYEDALRTLRRLTGHPLDGFAPVLPAADGACPSLEQAQAAATRRPAVALARADIDAQRERLQRADALDMDAGLSLTQSLASDLGGPNGRATTVGIDFSMPLGAHGLRDARRAEARAELARAELALETRLADAGREVEHAFALLAVREEDAAGRRRQLQSALRAWRIAQARALELDGDVLERELQTRYALYLAALDESRARQGRLLARLDWQARIGPGACDPGASRRGRISVPESASMSDEAKAALSGAAAAAAAARHLSGGSAQLGFFVWEAQRWLDAEPPWDRLPAGTRRVALSFTGAQIARLAEPAAAARLDALLRAAHGRGLSVEWLLGEPGWVLPAGRARLLALLPALAGFDFDAVHLDLERSQMPAADQDAWSTASIDTIAAVCRALPWPVVLTTHHREFADRAWVERAAAAGLGEGVAMIYVAAAARAEALARPLLDGLLPLAVAQSIEAGLPAAESAASAGRAGALERWRSVHARLSDAPGYLGVYVQSWEAYLEARP